MNEQQADRLIAAMKELRSGLGWTNTLLFWISTLLWLIFLFGINLGK